MTDINFIFSSVTFLQTYIPLVIEAKNRNLKCNFFIRKNSKTYADPITHKKFYEKIIKQYDINVYSIEKIVKFKGIVFLVDGDIYGPSEKYYLESCIKYLKPYHKKISFIENLNYFWSYKRYIPYMDHVIFPNKIYATFYDCVSSKNIYMGVPKYDIKFDKNDILKKFELKEDNKYVLIFYPRFDRGIKMYKNFITLYNNLILWLRNMGYKIIIKNREKLKIVNKTWDYQFNDIYFYPNISMELLEICDLAVYFGSSVIEEIVMAKTPFIEILMDNVDRFPFLRDESYTYTIGKDNVPNETIFKDNIERIISNNNNYKFDEVTNQYLFNRDKICKKIYDIYL